MEKALVTAGYEFSHTERENFVTFQIYAHIPFSFSITILDDVILCLVLSNVYNGFSKEEIEFLGNFFRNDEIDIDEDDNLSLNRNMKLPSSSGEMIIEIKQFDRDINKAIVDYLGRTPK